MSIIPKINFIKANNYNNNDYFKKSDNNDCKQKSNQLNGNEIKEFYNNLITTYDPINDQIKQNIKTLTNKSCDKRVENNVTNSKTINNIKLESIFKYCQNGEIDKCLEWLRMGFDINIKDQYLWTPLMCSSCAGHQDIVDLLLKSGANTSAEDKKGRNAIDLALINGHKHIIESIIRHKKYEKKKRNDRKNENKDKEVVESESKMCSICGHEFSSSVKRHECSVVHQINSITDNDMSNNNNFYRIYQQNKGFKMMVKNGWSSDRGLGLLGNGRKFPIKTVLKRDRLGIGSCVKTKSKVTHFSPFDVNAVNNYKPFPDLKQSRKQRLKDSEKLENKLKRIEINFRHDFK